MIVAFKGPTRADDHLIIQSDTMYKYRETARLQVEGIVIDVPKTIVEEIRQKLAYELQKTITVNVPSSPSLTF